MWSMLSPTDRDQQARVTGNFGLVEESVDLQPDLEGLADTFMEGLRPWDGSWWLDRVGSCWEPEGLLTMRGWPR